MKGTDMSKYDEDPAQADASIQGTADELSRLDDALIAAEERSEDSSSWWARPTSRKRYNAQRESWSVSSKRSKLSTQILRVHISCTPKTSSSGWTSTASRPTGSSACAFR